MFVSVKPPTQKYLDPAKRIALVALLLCNACAAGPDVCVMDAGFAAQAAADFKALNSPEMAQAIRDAQALPPRTPK